MAEDPADRTYHVTILHAGDYEFVAEFTDVPDADRAKLERCEQLFENFCIVTESARQGIPVTVSVAQPESMAK